MIRYALPAAVAALAFVASAAFAQTGVIQPMPLTPPAHPLATPASVSGAYAVPDVGYPAPSDMASPMGVVPVPPQAVWIPGHYNWDPNSQNYVWLDGEFAQPPHPGAQWVPGHWQQTPTAWTWVDGRWS
jgi:hypothetical protein